MSALNTRLTAPADFERAFNIAHPWLIKELKNNWVDEKRITQGMANDTVAAHLQALDLVKAIHKAGYSIADMHRWIQMLVAADEEERAKLRAMSDSEFDKPFEAKPVLTVRMESMSNEDIPFNT